MVTTSNKEILDRVFNALISVLGSISSKSYSLLILNIFIGKAKTKYPFAKNINVYNSESISINDEINSIDPKEIGAFINFMLDDLLKSFKSKEKVQNQIKTEIKGYIGYSYELKLKNICVNL